MLCIPCRATLPRTSYEYRCLIYPRTIRLLVIHPSQESTSRLSCHLKVVSLDSVPPYEALSYTWCKQDDGYLKCNGKKLGVRRNLREALTRLRGTVVQRMIWTDAICINQHDEEEKARQIELMQEIYNKATRVLVWLGEDVDRKAERAFGRIYRISQPENIIPPPEDPWWDPVAAFYRCAWFSRLWVFQEITMATSADLHWGAYSISWRTVGSASTQIRTRHYQAILHHSMLNVYNAFLFWKLSKIGGYSHQHESLLYMLQVTRRLRCTFQKDRINALSGFANVHMSLNKFPKPKERTQSVYRKCAQQLIEKMHTLDVLSAVQHESVIRRWSWVPRWNICTAHTMAPLGLNLETYDASRHLPPLSVQWTGNWGEFLHVEGIQFDAITKVEQTMIEPENLNELQATLVNVLSRLFTGASSHPTGESLEKVACFTLTAGKDGYGMMVKDVRQHLANFDAFWANRACVTNHHLPRWPSGISSDAGCFLLAARFACVGRRLFHTSRGYVGMGPALLQTGDIVCVLSGGAMPFILRQDRRSRPSKRRFQLIGEAYVHGIMHGEAAGQCINGRLPNVAFNIV